MVESAHKILAGDIRYVIASLLFSTKQVDLEVTCKTCIQEALVSHFDQNTAYSNRSSSWFSSVPPRKLQEETNSSSHPSTRRYVSRC
jgi:hypothetical protein